MVDDQDNWLDYSQSEHSNVYYSGGFGYTSPTSYTNLAKTSAGLSAGAFVGLTADSDQTPGYGPGRGMSALRAWRYLYNSWNFSPYSWYRYHWGSMYAMYGVKKASYSFKPNPTCIHSSPSAANLYLSTEACSAAGGHPWEAEYYDFFTKSGRCLTEYGLSNITCRPQRADGSWRDYAGAPNSGHYNGGRGAFATAMVVLILTPQIFEIGPVAVANADPALANPGDLITFNHDGSYHPADPDNHVISYVWDWDSADGLWWQADPQPEVGVDGYVPDGCTLAAGDCVGFVAECAPGDLVTCKALRPQHRYNDDLAPGEEVQHAVTLMVLDDHEDPLSDIDDESVRIRISRLNHPPVSICDRTPPANPGEPNYQVGQFSTVTLDGGGSFDPDSNQPPEAICEGMDLDSIVVYEWDLDNDGNFDDGVGPIAAFTPPPGAPIDQLFPVRLRVVDDGMWADCNAGSVAGQAAETTCLIQIVPNQPPTANAVPDGTTFECTSAAGALVTLDGTGSSDPDPEDVLGFSWLPADGLTGADTATPSGTFPIGGPYVRTLTVTDTYGETSSDEASFSVADRVAPALDCGPGAAECAGPAGTPVALSASVTDVCDTAPAVSNDGLPLYPAGNTTVTWTATDASANTTVCSSLVTVSDTLAPVVSCEGNLEECAGELTDVSLLGFALDQCDGELPVTPSTVGPYGLGDTPVTFTATDAANNVGTCVAAATVVDTTAPVITCQDGANECTSPQGAPVVLAATATDLCTADVAVAGDTLAVYPIGDTTVVFTADDGNGNTASCPALATVVDTTAPDLTCPTDQSLECTSPAGASLPLVAQASDVCDDAVELSDTTLAVYPIGTTGVTFTAVDDYDNASDCALTVTVGDYTAPAVTCADAAAECAAPAGTPVALVGDATDACDEDLGLNNDAPALFGVGETAVTWTATDDAGLVGTCGAVVTVSDTTSPALDCQPNQAECVGALTPVLLNASAADVCDGPLTPLLDNIGPYTLGDTAVVWSVSDAAGNGSECPTVATVVDTTAPVVTCGGGDAECAAPEGTPVALTSAATDICAADVQLTSDALALYPLGATTVTFVGDDTNGNTASCQAVATVVDTTAPAITCPADATLILDATCHASESYVATGADVCFGALSDSYTFGFATHETQTHTYTVTDGVGLATSCAQSVNALDVTPPVLTCPDDATLVLDPLACTATATYTAGALDACDGPSSLDHTFAFAAVGSETFEYGFADLSSNAAACSQTVQAIDTTAPVYTAGPMQQLWPPNHKYVELTLASCGTLIDACDGALDLDGGAAVITRVSSDEPEDVQGAGKGKGKKDGGDGSTVDDMVLVNAYTVKLRAERQGTSDGRVYTIHFQVPDAAGNVTEGTCKVGVPHDQGGQPVAIEGPPVYWEP